MDKVKILLLICLICYLSSCDKYDLNRTNKVDPKSANYDPPQLSTTHVTAIASNSVTTGGNVTSEGGSPVTSRGVCWTTSTKPTISDNKTSDGVGNGIFRSSITGLNANTIYYIRAYATNSSGTTYGDELTFTTPETITDNDYNVYNTVYIGSQLWMKENLKTTKYNNGMDIPNVTDSTIWSTLSTPGFCWYKNDPVSFKNTYGGLYNWFAINTGELCPNGWHVPSDAEWTILTEYLNGENVGGKLKEAGNTHWFSPNAGATNETGFTALPAGSRSNLQGFTSLGYYGYWWSETAVYLSADAYCRYLAYDQSTGGIKVEGNKKDGFSVRCLKGVQALPSLTTLEISSITPNSAYCGGNIASDGGSSIIDRGICWSVSENPTILDNKTNSGLGSGEYLSHLTGLKSNTTYYCRAYATNNHGTSYGNEVNFTTTSEWPPIVFNPYVTYGSLTDIDGNIYKSIKIGTQTWMAENLKTTKYNDGTDIPLVTENTTWINLTTGAFCWVENSEDSYKNTYGALYNWHAVNRGDLCPTGWHIPNNSELTLLTTYLGSNAGGKLKESGLVHWISPNIGATNETGFSGLPGSFRFDIDGSGGFQPPGFAGYWWSSSENTSTTAWFTSLNWSHGGFDIGGNFSKNYGFSVRCLKD